MNITGSVTINTILDSGINSYANTTMTGQGNLSLGGAGTAFDNYGTFSVQTDSNINNLNQPGQDPPVFKNEDGATFTKKSGNGGTTQVNVTFTNQGALSLQTGTLNFTQTVTQNGNNASTVLQGGSLTVSGGANNGFQLESIRED